MTLTLSHLNTESHEAAWTGLETVIFLPRPPKQLESQLCIRTHPAPSSSVLSPSSGKPPCQSRLWPPRRAHSTVHSSCRAHRWDFHAGPFQAQGTISAVKQHSNRTRQKENTVTITSAELDSRKLSQVLWQECEHQTDRKIYSYCVGHCQKSLKVLSYLSPVRWFSRAAGDIISSLTPVPSAMLNTH